MSDEIGSQSALLWGWMQSGSQHVSYITVFIVAIITYIIYKLTRSDPEPDDPPLPPMKKQDMTLTELLKYNGQDNKSGRICVAVNGKIFDVTRGKKFYGPGGPYSGFAGRDASRGLATFSVEPVSDDYDDLSDMKPSEMEHVKEWELQFSEKYTLVGRLLKPGQEPNNYSEEEDDDEDEEDVEKKH